MESSGWSGSRRSTIGSLNGSPPAQSSTIAGVSSFGGLEDVAEAEHARRQGGADRGAVETLDRGGLGVTLGSLVRRARRRLVVGVVLVVVEHDLTLPRPGAVSWWRWRTYVRT